MAKIIMTQAQQKTATLKTLSPEAQNMALENVIRQFVSCLGQDPDSAELKNTPALMREAWQFWISGYQMDPVKVLNAVPALSKDGDDMIIVRDIPIYTHCEKYLTPIIGFAQIAYIPKKRSTELSNISRLVDVFARRLQSQNGLTNQIADALYEHLQPAGVGVVLNCQHMSMLSRGGRTINASTLTRGFRGNMKSERKLRDEFLSSISVNQKI